MSSGPGEEGRTTRLRRMPGSGPEGHLDQVARHRVEEAGEEEEQQQAEEQPALGVPQEVVGRLERVQEPDEARVRPAGAARGAGGVQRKDAADEGSGCGEGPWPRVGLTQG